MHSISDSSGFSDSPELSPVGLAINLTVSIQGEVRLWGEKGKVSLCVRGFFFSFTGSVVRIRSLQSQL